MMTPSWDSLLDIARQSCHPSDSALDRLQLPQNKPSAKPQTAQLAAQYRPPDQHLDLDHPLPARIPLGARGQPPFRGLQQEALDLLLAPPQR